MIDFIRKLTFYNKIKKYVVTFSVATNQDTRNESDMFGGIVT